MKGKLSQDYFIHLCKMVAENGVCEVPNLWNQNATTPAPSVTVS